MILPEARRALQQLREALQYGNEHDGAVNIAELIRQLHQATGLRPTQFARRLGVAPQTVNRWQKGEVRPRPNQADKFENLLHEIGKIHEVGETMSTPQHDAVVAAPLAQASLGRASLAEMTASLGIRFCESMMELERRAKAVWVVKNGWLRESGDGYIGEMVSEALHHGVEFHYVFFQGTPAEESFRQGLQARVKSGSVAGAVTGYCVKGHQIAFELGLSDASITWILVEYSPEQVMLLKRRSDVFLAVGVLEYLDAAHTTLKNEEGQPCWIQLSTWHAGEWRARLSRLPTLATSSHEVEILRLHSSSSDSQILPPKKVVSTVKDDAARG